MLFYFYHLRKLVRPENFGHTLVFGLFGSTLFFHISHKRQDVWEKAIVRVVCFDLRYDFV